MDWSCLLIRGKHEFQFVSNIGLGKNLLCAVLCFKHTLFPLGQQGGHKMVGSDGNESPIAEASAVVGLCIVNIWYSVFE